MLSHVKRLINWARTDANLPLGIERPTVVREIETHLVVGGNGTVNGCIARPRNKDTCRGDAPPAAVFDEVCAATVAPKLGLGLTMYRPPFCNGRSGSSLPTPFSRSATVLRL